MQSCIGASGALELTARYSHFLETNIRQIVNRSRTLLILF